MSTNQVKSRFQRKKHLVQNQSKELSRNKASTERMKTSSNVCVCKKEYLTNKNLSIMTDTQLDPDVVDHVCLRRKKHGIVRASNSSSSTGSQDSYILISTEETPVKVKDVNWEYVDYDDVAENVRSGCVMKKYCSPRCSTAWFLKIRREILKNCRRKVYPLAIDG